MQTTNDTRDTHSDPLGIMHFQYRSLDASQKETRLLSIMGEMEGKLQCELHTVSLAGEMPRFTALSYVWGSSKLEDTILINGAELRITSSLSGALKSVKAHWQNAFPGNNPADFRLWADGISINQTEKSEQASQVQLMGILYESAELVIGWLGTAELERISLAFDTLSILGEGLEELTKRYDENPLQEVKMTVHDLEWLAGYPDICTRDPDGRTDINHLQMNRRWAAVYFLLGLPYWTRVWIFQEVALARRLLLACPLKTLDFRMLAHAAYEVPRITKHLCGSQPAFIDNDIWSLLQFETGRWHRIDNITLQRDTRASIKHLAGATQQELLKRAAYGLALASTELKATNPRDYVYGMLGLNALPIIPNYSNEQPYDTRVEYVRAWTALPTRRHATNMGSTCQLAFLSMAGIGFFEYPPGCPSWAPNFTEMTEISRYPGLPIGATNNDMLLGANDTLEITGEVLKARGLVIQTVSRTELLLPKGTRGEIGDVARALLRYLGGFVSRHPQYITGISSLQAFTRVLLQDFTSPMSKDMFHRGFVLLFTCMISCHSGGDRSFVETAVHELGLTPGTKIINWIVDNFWGASEIRETGISHRAILEFSKKSFSDIPEYHTANSIQISDVFSLMMPFETEDGYLVRYRSYFGP